MRRLPPIDEETARRGSCPCPATLTLRVHRPSESAVRVPDRCRSSAAKPTPDRPAWRSQARQPDMTSVFARFLDFRTPPSARASTTAPRASRPFRTIAQARPSCWDQRRSSAAFRPRVTCKADTIRAAHRLVQATIQQRPARQPARATPISTAARRHSVKTVEYVGHNAYSVVTPARLSACRPARSRLEARRCRPVRVSL